ncbi:DUF6907 domain-containing protein [Streptomyces malaysiensis]|uniref:Uncharacterized protein n=1 Tax=Streptomyces malaysiensis subsp. samsunensis TaxID=459658 RepID=A0A9X2RUU3_STRMQ|nr:hypothetical protein [Streptomyces samsunensis]MCQ8831806.1 hypothetical protein [Streptomyces samsunensis]
MTVLPPTLAQQPAATSVTPPPVSPRLVAAVVRGQRIAIPCFDWCVRDHSKEDLAFLEDLSHEGEEIALAAPEFGGVTEVLVASIRQWPFVNDEDRGLPYLGLDATGEGEAENLQKGAALAFADQLVAHAARIRQLAENMPD